MQAKHVELVTAIAEAGSLGAAALRLNKSQPALSKALQAAEREIGCQIFHRGPHGVVPTVEGERVIERCRQISRDLDLLDEDVAQIQGGVHGTLNVVVSPFAAVKILPPVLSRLARRFPGVQVEVVGGHSSRAYQMLRARRADFVIGPAPEPGTTFGLRSRHLVSTSITIVTGEGSRYLTQTDAEALGQAQWLLIGPRERQPTYAAYFEAKGMQAPKPILCSDSILTIMSVLEGTDFLCSFPSLLVADVAEKWRIGTLDLDFRFPDISISLTSELTRVPTMAGLAFEDLVMEEAARLTAPAHNQISGQ